MIPDESLILDEVCKEAYDTKKRRLQYDSIHLAERIIWKNAILLTGYHVVLFGALIMYAFRLHPTPFQWKTIIWATFFAYGVGLGVTAGAHRLWTHRAYKAKLPLRIFLMILYSGTGMNNLFAWIRDHRVHHKYSETDADPHNAKRGFFFAHMGWLMLKRHPEYLRVAKAIDMTDILEDPVAMFQRKYATWLVLIFCFIIPTAVPIIFWQEYYLHAILSQCFIRYMIGQHFVWSVNSVAHLWGPRPYNKFINPAENLVVSVMTGGEGSHNYHHTFPWDYKASEFPYVNFNTTTFFIDVMAKLGLAYDLKEPSPELVEKVIHRIGYKSELKGNH